MSVTTNTKQPLLNDYGTVIGNRIRMRREEVGMSQGALARTAQVAQARVSEYESGARPLPRPHFDRIVKALGMSVERFCEGIQKHVAMTETQRDAHCLSLARRAAPANVFAQADLLVAMGCIMGAQPKVKAIDLVGKAVDTYSLAGADLAPVFEFIKSGV